MPHRTVSVDRDRIKTARNILRDPMRHTVISCGLTDPFLFSFVYRLQWISVAVRAAVFHLDNNEFSLFVRQNVDLPETAFIILFKDPISFFP